MITEPKEDVASLFQKVKREEANYTNALKQDKEFSVLKVIRRKIKLLKESINNLVRPQDTF